MATKHANVSNLRDELVPKIVDHLANVVADEPYALYPNSPLTYDRGYRTVTYKDFANAINGLAWWLHKTLGPSDNFEVLAYIGPNDLRYNALMVAATKAGYLAFFTSPRNSIAAHVSLLQQTRCHILLTSDPTPPGVGAILSATPVKHLQIPSVKGLLDEVFPVYEYQKSYETSKSEPILIVHTSGSTGMPKPIYWTHDTFATHMRMTSLDPPASTQSYHRLHQGKRILNTFPPFHAASFGVGFLNSLQHGSVSISPTSSGPPSADGMIQALKHAPAQIAFLIPLIAAELVQKPDLLDYCSQHLEHLFYVGGHLPQALGDVIASKVPIHCQYGATEIGLTHQIFSDVTAKEWQYVQFHPELGHEFEEITPGMFELLVRKHTKYEQNQVTFKMRPGLDKLEVYRTRDLFEKHPILPDHWVWRARSDDIIVFLNGEKTNPISMEQHIIASNDTVANAMVIGMQRFQAALLVEPTENLRRLDEVEARAFIESIWASVDQANQVAPAHARIEKTMVMITSPDKPIIRSGKGTSQRQPTIALYETEIEELYTRVETQLHGFEKASVDTKDPVQISRLIKQELSKIGLVPMPQHAANLFSLGLDSLMAMRLIRALRHGLGRLDLDVSVVYNHPSIKQLTEYLVDPRLDQVAPQDTKLELLLAQYKETINSIRSQPFSTEPRKSAEVVVLTGTTGSIGTHLLSAFLADPGISQIYCLNRREHAEKVQLEKSKAAGFPLSQYQERITFVHADLNLPNLGLEISTYNHLRAHATIIVHNAWPVDFIAPVEHFRPNLNGLVNLFQLAAGCAVRPKMLYISSVSSVAKLSTSIIPEEIIEDLSASQDIGYAKSKLLAELLCDFTARRLHIPISVARVGQVAGPADVKSTALWNTSEWLPSLILTSASIGILPDDLGPDLNKVNWMPVDILSKALVELIMGTDGPKNFPAGANWFNVVGPAATTWKDVLPAMTSSLERHAFKSMDVVSLKTWLEKLQRLVEEFCSGHTGLVATHPAIKLQEFYEKGLLNSVSSVDWDTRRAVSKSEALRKMPAVKSEWIEKWVEGWMEELRSREASRTFNKLVAKGAFRR